MKILSGKTFTVLLLTGIFIHLFPISEALGAIRYCDSGDVCPPLVPVSGEVQTPAVVSKFHALGTSAALTTLFTANNVGSFGGGIYFDLEVVGGQPVNIQSWDVNIGQGTWDVSVWYRLGTSQGFEQTTSGWNLLGTETGLVSQWIGGIFSNTPTPLGVGGLVLQPSQVYGIAMSLVPQGGQTSGGWHYTNGNGGNQTYNDGQLELRAGSANNVAFSSGVFSPRVWNGTIYYSFGTAVTTTNPIPTLSQWGIFIFSLLLLALLMRNRSRGH